MKTQTLTDRIENYGVKPPKSKIDYKILNNSYEKSLEKNHMLMQVQEAIRASALDSITRIGKQTIYEVGTQTTLMDVDWKLVYDYKYGGEVLTQSETQIDDEFKNRFR